MIRLRVVDPPARHKCATCAHGRVTSYESGRVETLCSHGMANNKIRGVVKHCTEYDYVYSYEDSRMTKLAWILETKRGRVIGFKPPGSDDGIVTN
jgi:hypothetical protein